MTWIAAHLSWFVWVLIVIWAPPVIYTVAIDVGLIAAPGSGFPSLRDPALMTALLQLALMAAALPGLPARRPRSWKFLAAALGAWAVHAGWATLSRLRLDGARSLRAPETWWPLAAIAIAAVILHGVRGYFGGAHTRGAHGHDRPQVAPTGPAHVP